MSEYKIKGPVRADADSDTLILDAGGGAIELNANARAEVIYALNGYGLAVEALENIRKVGDDWAAKYANNILKELGELDE